MKFQNFQSLVHCRVEVGTFGTERTERYYCFIFRTEKILLFPAQKPLLARGNKKKCRRNYTEGSLSFLLKDFLSDKKLCPSLTQRCGWEFAPFSLLLFSRPPPAHPPPQPPQISFQTDKNVWTQWLSRQSLMLLSRDSPVTKSIRTQVERSVLFTKLHSVHTIEHKLAYTVTGLAQIVHVCVQCWFFLIKCVVESRY